MGTRPEFQGWFFACVWLWCDQRTRGGRDKQIYYFNLHYPLFFYKFLKCGSMSISLALNSQITILALHCIETFSNASGIHLLTLWICKKIRFSCIICSPQCILGIDTRLHKYTLHLIESYLPGAPSPLHDGTEPPNKLLRKRGGARDNKICRKFA